MDGEVEWYRGLEVEFKSGKPPTLTLYRDGVEEEGGGSISISHFQTRDEIHDYFINLGFERKSEKEILKVKEEYYEKDKEQRTVIWSRKEARHQMKEDIEAFRKNVLQVDEANGFSPRWKGADMLESNYRTIFGMSYLTFQEKLDKADQFLLKGSLT